MSVSLSSFDSGGGSGGQQADPMSLSSYDAPKGGGGGGGGIIGGILHHVPKIGLGNFVHMVGGIPYGLAALATGKGGYEHVWGAAAKGLGSSLMGTAESVPGVGYLANHTGFNDKMALALGEQYRPHPVWDVVSERGILPAVAETLGNVSIGGAVAGKLAKAGDVGRLGAAAEAASAAEKAGFTASEVTSAADRLREAGGSLKDAGIGNKLLRTAAKAAVKADGLTADAEAIASRARIIHGAELATHPYQSIFNHVIRPVTAGAQAATLAADAAPAAAPLTAEAAHAAAAEGLSGIAQSAPDAALARTRAMLGSAAHEATGAPGGVVTADDQIAKLSGLLPEHTTAADATIGPLEDAVRRSTTPTIGPRAEAVVAHLPEPVRNFLASVEGHIQGHQTKNVIFERMRAQLADRNKIMASEPVRAGLETARRFVTGKVLEDGTKIGPDLADRLIGDEVMARLSGVKHLEDTVVRAAPEARDVIRAALVESGDRAMQSLPADVLSDPAFEEAVAHLTDTWKTAAGERLVTYENSRLGTQGLETARSDVPTMTKGQKSQMAAIRKGTEGVAALSRKAERERAAVERLIARHTATSAQIDTAIEKAHLAEDQAKAAFESARGAPVAEGRSLAQEAVTKLPEGAAATEHGAYRAGVVSGRQIEQAAKFGETADQLIKRKAVLDKQVADLHAMIDNYKLPSQVARLKLESKVAGKIDRLGVSLDDPSLLRTPADWQPVYAALKDLHASAVTNPALAKALEGLPERFSTVLQLAAEKGFDPAHIRSFEPGQVRRLVYGQVTLGKAGIELGKTIEAGTRKGRLIGQARTRSLSALAGAMVEATHEHNTNALATFIEDTWAKKVPEDGVVPKGWVPWDAAKRHLTTAESTSPGVTIHSASAERMIPQAVKNTLDSFSRDYNHPIFKAIKTVTNPWKMLVLTMNPGWYVNHFVGHVVGAFKEGTNLNDWANAWSEYRRGGAAEGTNRITAKIGRGADAFAGNPVVENQSFVSDLDKPQMVQFPHGTEGLKLARETTGNRSAVRLFMDRYRAPIKTIDDISRAAVFNAAKRGGASEAEALQRATEAFLDYQRLGPFEQQIVNSVVPFYSFQKAMMRAVVKMPLDHPVATGFLMTLSDLNQAMNRDIYGTDMPSYYENLIKLPGVGTVNIGKFNPFEHAPRAFTSPQAIAGAINPFISAAIRNAYGAPSYEPHNAQGQLVAPQTRLNEFGVEVPATDLGTDVGESLGGVPLARLIGAQTQTSGISGRAPTGRGIGAEKFVGIPAMPPEQLAALLKRVMRYRAAQQGSVSSR